MIYTLRKFIDWGPDHADEYPAGWHYLSTMKRWDSSWSMKLSKAIIFENRDAAVACKLDNSHMLGEDNSKNVEVYAIDEKDYFIAKLAGN